MNIIVRQTIMKRDFRGCSPVQCSNFLGFVVGSDPKVPQFLLVFHHFLLKNVRRDQKVWLKRSKNRTALNEFVVLLEARIRDIQTSTFRIDFVAVPTEWWSTVEVGAALSMAATNQAVKRRPKAGTTATS